MLAQSLGQALERRLQSHGRKDGTSRVMNFRGLLYPHQPSTVTSLKTRDNNSRIVGEMDLQTTRHASHHLLHSGLRLCKQCNAHCNALHLKSRQGDHRINPPRINAIHGLPYVQIDPGNTPPLPPRPPRLTPLVPLSLPSNASLLIH